MRIKIKIFLFLLLLTGCTKKGNKVYYFIPEEVQSPFAIVYNQLDGKDRHEYKNSQLFIIPKNGILLTKESPVLDKKIKKNFYHIDSNKIILKEIRNFHFDSFNKLPLIDSVYYFNSYIKTFEKPKKDELLFQIFLIGKDYSEQSFENLNKEAKNLENRLIKRFGYGVKPSYP